MYNYVCGYMFPYRDPRARVPLVHRRFKKRMPVFSTCRFRGATHRHSFYKPFITSMPLPTRYYHPKGRILKLAQPPKRVIIGPESAPIPVMSLQVAKRYLTRQTK